MNTLQSSKHHTDLVPVRVLAALLERLEGSSVAVDAAQYATVVARLSDALTQAESNDALGDLLSSHPAAAELYENMQYEVAGLCRSPLDASMAAEQLASTVIQRAMQTPRESSANGQS
jgi:sigma54-dependent transcription regulator